MPEIEITIGSRNFEVACAEGEEHYLLAAARLLDVEASALTEQIGRLPEGRMLLMAGLMLADRTAGVEDKLKDSEAEVARLTAELEALKSQPAAEPERVEIPIVPESVPDALAEIAARAEALADTVEEKARPA